MTAASAREYSRAHPEKAQVTERPPLTDEGAVDSRDLREPLEWAAEQLRARAHNILQVAYAQIDAGHRDHATHTRRLAANALHAANEIEEIIGIPKSTIATWATPPPRATGGDPSHV